MRELTVIYQDGIGATPWAHRTRRLAEHAGIKLNRISFATPYAQGVIKQARADKKWPGAPCITDGEKFSQDIEDFIQKPKQKKGIKK